MSPLTGVALGLLVMAAGSIGMVRFVVSHLKPRDRADREQHGKHAPSQSTG
ncbi:hypothetical protein [Thiomonas arsenitoxydans]|jgi:hypothetical protein|uniref:hypothetical protein n=1 Tax=Thiomonas arsenitoxydans (strain DSM 22701 / CIP 110005 / 3As) TaxID=426114 RepID=UPI000B3020B8|nr:hypothetical protein [Thiomonas arsenitoxydans]